MKKSKIAAILLASALTLSACGSAKDTAKRNSNTKIMKIGDEEVSRKDFFDQLDFYSKLSAMNQGVIGNIQSSFIRDYFFKKQIKDGLYSISDKEYEEEIKKAIDSIGGDKKLDEYLDTIGESREIYEDNIKKSFRERKYGEWYRKQHKPDQAKIKEEYDNNKTAYDKLTAYHILLDSEDQANKIYEELKAGKDFKQLSDEFNKDDYSKQAGGKVGEITRTSPLAPEFIEAAFKLKEGEFSKPVKSSFGYHIIKVTDIKNTMEAAENDILAKLLEGEYQSHLDEELKKIKFEVFDKNGKSLTNPEQKEESQNKDEKKSNDSMNEEEKKDSPENEKESKKNSEENKEKAQ